MAGYDGRLHQTPTDTGVNPGIRSLLSKQASLRATEPLKLLSSPTVDSIKIAALPLSHQTAISGLFAV